MLLRIQNYVDKLKPVTVDGALYILIALFGFLATAFGSDESKEMMSKSVLFWVKVMVGAMSAILLALKMFRSTSYADHQKEKQYEKTNPPSSPVA